MSMIWLPKKELVVPCPSPRIGVRGLFKFDAVRPDGRVRPLTGWFPNLITDIGLNRIGSGGYLAACQVGTNNTAPTVNDSGLAGYRAGTTTQRSSSYSATTSAPYYGWKRITFRFGVGAASGNLAEVAIATGAAQSGSTNFSRALILDEYGDPTTITVLSDEVLDVTYELRLYPDLVDRTGTVTISGSGDHAYTLRASIVANNLWGQYLGSKPSFDPFGGANTLAVFNGAIGAVTGGPSGNSGAVRPWTAAYGNNNLYVDGTGSFGLDQGNLPGYIKSVRYQTSLGAYQYELDPVIQKDSTNTLTLTQRISWARYTP